MNTNEPILVTGAKGLVGSAIVRALKAQGFTEIWEANRSAVDLENRESTNWFFDECKPSYVFHCAAKVGGIADNLKSPATFLLTNLDIEMNVLCAANNHDVKKLLFLSSAACYPNDAQSPLAPSALMTGPFDETKSGYAMAKLAGMQMCKEFRKEFGSNFISVISNNVYGPDDTSHHVIPDLLRKFHLAKTQAVLPRCWGTGIARREFIYADDLAAACLFLMDNYNEAEPINVGPGSDVYMTELVGLVGHVVGYAGHVMWDDLQPEGTLRRLLDVSKINNLGWTPRMPLEQGLNNTYQALCEKR